MNIGTSPIMETFFVSNKVDAQRENGPGRHLDDICLYLFFRYERYSAPSWWVN